MKNKQKKQTVECNPFVEYCIGRDELGRSLYVRHYLIQKK